MGDWSWQNTLGQATEVIFPLFRNQEMIQPRRRLVIQPTTQSKRITCQGEVPQVKLLNEDWENLWLLILEALSLFFPL